MKVATEGAGAQQCAPATRRHGGGAEGEAVDEALDAAGRVGVAGTSRRDQARHGLFRRVGAGVLDKVSRRILPAEGG